jgi:gamma-glutamyltranspeptidase/glutathione hydrolase
MKRRSFLKFTGSVCTSAFLGGNLSFGKRLDASAARGSVHIDDSMLQNRNQNRSTVVCQNGIVCSSQPLAGMAGVDILKAGGNAIDAAICANAMLSVVEPMMCGPGGDLFAIVWNEKERRLFGLNASGRSPYDWTIQQAQTLGLKEIPVHSPLSWSVPGCVSGWAALQKRFGSLTLAQALEPAIFYTREGFPVSPVIATSWSFGSIGNPALTKTFMPDGKAVRFGDIFKNPDLGLVTK